MYNRLFTFGCSFTSWHWPTWADILGQEFKGRFKNLGMCAAGNEFIFHRLIECHARENLTKDDLIIICWTNFAREDRYLPDRGWTTAGNIFTQNLYNKEWIKRWFDLRGALIKTVGFISAVKMILDQIGCRYEFISMMPMDQINEYDIIFLGEEHKDVLQLYAQTLSHIKPSITETLWGKGSYQSHNPVNFYYEQGGHIIWDNHPGPSEHLDYLNLMLPELGITLSSETIDYVNVWEQKVRSGSYVSEWTPRYRARLHHSGYFRVT